jgi:FixJ family two-component response regulator
MTATPHNIVLVEDDEGLRSALVRILELAGFRVESYASAEDALAAGAAARAGCIVCDVYLPRESGFTLCRRLSQGGARPPVIFITAHDLPAVRAEAEALGAANCLIKPFPGRALVEAVRAALASA